MTISVGGFCLGMQRFPDKSKKAKRGGILKEQGFLNFPFMPDLKAIAEQNNIALENMFRGRIRGYFLIDVKEQVMKVLGLENLVKYYDFCWSDARMITGIGEAVEYDICRMIVGIHKAYFIFLSDDEMQKNEKSKRYKRQLISETIEKIKMRLYGSTFYRKIRRRTSMYFARLPSIY